jgi:hypothetical protein
MADVSGCPHFLSQALVETVRLMLPPINKRLTRVAFVSPSPPISWAVTLESSFRTQNYDRVREQMKAAIMKM